jgi:hypothetical protein
MVDPEDKVTQELPGVDVVVIPPKPKVTQEQMNQWYNMTQELKKLKASEMLLRKMIFGDYFAEPKEGTNTAPLDAGWVLKGVHKIDREVDIGALSVMKFELEKMGIRADVLVEYKPSLKVKEYRELTEEQQKLFDRCLIIKPGSPSLSIELPAKAAKK